MPIAATMAVAFIGSMPGTVVGTGRGKCVAAWCCICLSRRPGQSFRALTSPSISIGYSCTNDASPSDPGPTVWPGLRETEPEGAGRLRYALAPSWARTRELRGPGMAQTVSSVSLPYQSRTPHAQATGAPCFAKHVCGLPRNFHTERTPLKRRRAFNSTSTRMCDKRYLLAPFLSPQGAG